MRTAVLGRRDLVAGGPTDNSVLIFLAHHMPELPQMASGIGPGVWSTIAKFHELASA